jgi:phenylacetate-CoA ligase
MTGMPVTASGTSDLSGLQARFQAELGTRLAEHVRRLEWDAERLASHQRDSLQQLLRRALELSPFHARRLGRIDPARFEVPDLERLPTMTKAEMMANFDEVTTDRRLSRRLVEGHLSRSHTEAGLLLGDYVCLASGGSSGQRGVFVQTLSEYADFVASLIRRGAARAAALGGPGNGMVIGLVAAASPVHSSGFAAAVARGGPVRLASVPATLPIGEAVERLNAADPPSLLGYPSRLARLAVEKRAGRLRIAPQSVTSNSEMLTAVDRLAITEAFGVPVIDQFVSTEGLVGCSDPGGTVLIMADDNCILELVDRHNRPVPLWTASAKVLVTNLHNLTQPLIRYELTDRFVAVQDSAADGHLRVTVDGRADDIFRYGAIEVHPIVVRTVMVATPAAAEYQVRQTGRGISVAVVANDRLDESSLAASLAESLHQAGLRAPEVTVKVVASIRRDRRTGKTRQFVPTADTPGSQALHSFPP